MKFRLQNDIIVYRNDRYSEKINGKIEKFISTSIVPNGVLGKKANIAIIVPKKSNGSYIELLADDLYKRQREFLINKSSTLKLIKYLNGLYIFKVG